MPKNKSHKGTLKRMGVTGRNKVKHKPRGTSHLMSTFTGKRRRQLRKSVCVPRPVAKQLEGMLHRRLKGADQA